MEPLTMIAGLFPLGVEFGKALISKFFGADQFKPTNVDDWLKIRGSDIDLFKVMNEAGGSNESYKWVEAIVRLQRPMVALIVLSVWGIAHFAGQGDTIAVDNFASAVGFYLFGDRTLFYVRKATIKS